MRTTLDLPEPLLRKAQKLARRRKMTLQAMMAEVLQRYLATEETPRRPFKLPDRSFQGDGLVEGADWARIRDPAHEGRGP